MPRVSVSLGYWIAFPNVPIHYPRPRDSLEVSASSANPGYHLVSIDPRDPLLRVRSLKCSGSSLDTSQVCSLCRGVAVLVDIAKEKGYLH